MNSLYVMVQPGLRGNTVLMWDNILRPLNGT